MNKRRVPGGGGSDEDEFANGDGALHRCRGVDGADTPSW
jgi:hypothetical protein